MIPRQYDIDSDLGQMLGLALGENFDPERQSIWEAVDSCRSWGRSGVEHAYRELVSIVDGGHSEAELKVYASAEGIGYFPDFDNSSYNEFFVRMRDRFAQFLADPSLI